MPSWGPSREQRVVSEICWLHFQEQSPLGPPYLNCSPPYLNSSPPYLKFLISLLVSPFHSRSSPNYPLLAAKATSLFYIFSPLTKVIHDHHRRLEKSIKDEGNKSHPIVEHLELAL